jgi:hypothetical protein
MKNRFEKKITNQISGCRAWIRGRGLDPRSSAATCLVEDTVVVEVTLVGLENERRLLIIVVTEVEVVGFKVAPSGSRSRVVSSGLGTSATRRPWPSSASCRRPPDVGAPWGTRCSLRSSKECRGGRMPTRLVEEGAVEEDVVLRLSCC